MFGGKGTSVKYFFFSIFSGHAAFLSLIYLEYVVRCLDLALCFGFDLFLV